MVLCITEHDIPWELYCKLESWLLFWLPQHLSQVPWVWFPVNLNFSHSSVSPHIINTVGFNSFWSLKPHTINISLTLQVIRPIQKHFLIKISFNFKMHKLSFNNSNQNLPKSEMYFACSSLCNVPLTNDHSNGHFLGSYPKQTISFQDIRIYSHLI